MLKHEAQRRVVPSRGELGPATRQSSADRHILLGVSHPSNDPALHRTFEVHATYDDTIGGWTARFGEKNANDQLASWGARLMDNDTSDRFPTAADCLGSAVTSIIAMVEREADDQP